jgi:hypothetical protein
MTTEKTLEKKLINAQLRLTESHQKQLKQLKAQTGVTRGVAFRAALDYYLPRVLSGEIPPLPPLQLGKAAE